jgi:hypothetical protein
MTCYLQTSGQRCPMNFEARESFQMSILAVGKKTNSYGKGLSIKIDPGANLRAWRYTWLTELHQI